MIVILNIDYSLQVTQYMNISYLIKLTPSNGGRHSASYRACQAGRTPSLKSTSINRKRKRKRERIGVSKLHP